LDRQVVEASQMMWLLVAFAVTAATFSGLGFVIARRNKRPARGLFVLGVVCGAVAGPILQRRSRHLRALRGAIRSADRFAARVLALAARRQSSRR
jgi:hypothetical protein